MNREEKGYNLAAEAGWDLVETLLDALSCFDGDGFGAFLGIVVIVFLVSFGWKAILKLIEILSTGA